MSSLNEHFKQSGYSIHQSAMRKSKLSACCRENLHSMNIGIKYLNLNGADVILSVLECSVCGKRFALLNGKYMFIGNILKFETVNLKQ